MSLWFLVLAQLCVVAHALVGGVFLAFSDFIMRSLAKTGSAGGIETMQVINAEVFRWVFMPLFLGLVPASLVVAGYALLSFGGPLGAVFAAAGLVYVAGCFGVTAACNVPMNETLAGLEPSDVAARDYWRGTYLRRWTAWNTVRTVACVVASATTLAGLLLALQVETG